MLLHEDIHLSHPFLPGVEERQHVWTLLGNLGSKRQGWFVHRAIGVSALMDADS